MSAHIPASLGRLTAAGELLAKRLRRRFRPSGYRLVAWGGGRPGDVQVAGLDDREVEARRGHLTDADIRNGYWLLRDLGVRNVTPIDAVRTMDSLADFGRHAPIIVTGLQLGELRGMRRRHSARRRDRTAA